MKKCFEEFKNYHNILVLGFIGGIVVWIFSYTFESLLSQMKNNFWYTFGASLIVAFVWYFILSVPLFFILKFFGLNFKKK